MHLYVFDISAVLFSLQRKRKVVQGIYYIYMLCKQKSTISSHIEEQTWGWSESVKCQKTVKNWSLTAVSFRFLFVTVGARLQAASSFSELNLNQLLEYLCCELYMLAEKHYQSWNILRCQRSKLHIWGFHIIGKWAIHQKMWHQH